MLSTSHWIGSAILIATLAAAPVWAQTATDADAGTDAGATAEAGATDQADAQPDVTVEEFRDWQVRCDGVADNCIMYQLARDSSDNPVSEFTLLTLPDGGEAEAGVTVITPLGTLLTEGLVMWVDSGQARRYEFGWCTRSGCFARFGLTPDDVAVMKRGAVANVRLISASSPEQPVTLNVSLSGFTAAYDRLVELSSN